jgi:hypothetical protein
MKHKRGQPQVPIAVALLLTGILAALASGVFAETIDPDGDNSQWAWAENIGWINAEPGGEGGPGVTVGPASLSGYMWGENLGWVSMNCSNTASCGTVNYGVTNSAGALSGYAWAENAGWISFSCSNTGSCGTVNYGVTIHPTTGVFTGNAWGENVGWITFSDTSPVTYQVRTGAAGSGDTDGDGCPDVMEQQTADGSEVSGGRRDYLNPHDYFNPTGDGENRIDDVLAVLNQYYDDDTDGVPGLPPYSPGYNPNTDRTDNPDSTEPWDLLGPNGEQRIDDILAIIFQYFHNCS